MVLGTRGAVRSSLLYSRYTCMSDENATTFPVLHHFGAHNGDPAEIFLQQH